MHLSTLIDQYNVILHHVKGEENPTDLLTKNFVHNYAEEKLWVKGPKCLKVPDHWIPFKETPEWGNECTVLCTNIYQITCTKTDHCLPDSTRFSSLSKLLGSTWNVYKFKTKLIN